MDVTIVKEYWVLADKEKEYFLKWDKDGYIDWTPHIYEAQKFPSEQGAIHANNSRSYDIIAHEEVWPIKVKNTVEF